MPTLRAEFLRWGGGPEWPSLAQPRNNRTWEGVRAPQVCELIPLSSHLCSYRARDARGEGSASRESKHGGQVQALLRRSFPSSQGLPGSNLFLRRACFVSLFCKPELALAEFAICKLGRRRCYKPKEGRSLARAGGGVGDARVAGRAPGPGQAGIPHLLDRFSRSPSPPYLAFADLS